MGSWEIRCLGAIDSALTALLSARLGSRAHDFHAHSGRASESAVRLLDNRGSVADSALGGADFSAIGTSMILEDSAGLALAALTAASDLALDGPGGVGLAGDGVGAWVLGGGGTRG